jgi:hypothetical protein
VLRDDLTWAVGKIGQNIQRPIPEGKHLTVAPGSTLSLTESSKGPNLSFL